MLTQNPLYEAGPLAPSTCAELPVKPHDRASVHAYVDEVFRCLDSTWKPYLKKAGLPYEPVKVRYVERLPKTYCGSTTDSTAESEVWYCDWDRTISFKLGKSWLADPSDLWLFNISAQAYGYHVMKLAGLYDAGEELRAASKAEHQEQRRRLYLQSECLGGAFMQSVWPLKGRSADDWDTLLGLVSGGDPEDGRTSTIKSWMRAGFRTGDPGSCDTWTAPSSKVA